MRNTSVLTTSLIFLSFVAYAQPLDPLASYRALANNGQPQEAFQLLQTLFNSEKDPALKSKEALGLGILSFNSSKKELAARFLRTALDLKTRLDDYARVLSRTS